MDHIKRSCIKSIKFIHFFRAYEDPEQYINTVNKIFNHILFSSSDYLKFNNYNYFFTV